MKKRGSIGSKPCPILIERQSCAWEFFRQECRGHELFRMVVVAGFLGWEKWSERFFRHEWRRYAPFWDSRGGWIFGLGDLGMGVFSDIYKRRRLVKRHL
jgi:hypothetical protein